MKIRIDTGRYARNHHPMTPRGHGTWRFESADAELTFTYTGTYGQAAAEARNWAKSERLLVIYTSGD
jgi:hypothetical protein